MVPLSWQVLVESEGHFRLFYFSGAGGKEFEVGGVGGNENLRWHPHVLPLRLNNPWCRICVAEQQERFRLYPSLTPALADDIPCAPSHAKRPKTAGLPLLVNTPPRASAAPRPGLSQASPYPCGHAVTRRLVPANPRNPAHGSKRSAGGNLRACVRQVSSAAQWPNVRATTRPRATTCRKSQG
jgi:hypothetical protein